MPTPITFRIACENVLKDPKTNGYAKAYAEAGLDMTDMDEIRVQCLYILNNIQHWRGERARDTRDILKRWSEWSK